MGKDNILTTLTNSSLIESNLINSVTILAKQICHVLVLIKCFINVIIELTKLFQTAINY